MSVTATLSDTNTETITETVHESVTLQLPQERPGVSWSTDTVDNENLGRKSSKCCCIYKKPRKLGESSSESDSSDSGGELNRYEKAKKPKKNPHSHDNANCPEHDKNTNTKSSSTPA